MRKYTKLILGCLLFWFTLDITGFSLGKFVLVESPGLASIDFAWWVIFIACFTLFILKEKIGKYILTVFMFMWCYIQYTSHWHYTFFGATAKKLSSYNNYFKNTYHIVPISDSTIIPDFYHIILHLLILTSLLLLIGSLFRKNKSY